jgi:phosphatidylinositol-3-phosphatase
MSNTARLLTVVLFVGCAAPNQGVPGDPAVTQPLVEGTVFTIVFENENADDVLVPTLPNFYRLSQTYGRADAYLTNYHPSLANYIILTSGSSHGVTTSDPPASNVVIEGDDNLADQLDTAGIPWRAYMETMGEPCNERTEYPYVANHNPFVYYTSMTDDQERCRERVVDFDEHFAEDLASGQYRYMWITPNNCSNMHDCPASTADEYLGRLVEQIMASEAYQNGGVIFVLFDEGHLRIGRAEANLATIVISPNLVSQPYVTSTRFDHRSYLATVEDIFGLPRLPTTEGAAPMSEFLRSRDAVR